MDSEHNEHRLTRWIDGELEDRELREFEQGAADNPQIREAKAEADHLRKLLRANLSAEYDVPNPEFFNSEIQRRIEQETTPARGLPVTPAAGGILSWFLSPFTLASAAAVLILGLFALGQIRSGLATTDHTSVASTYTPDRDIVASHFYSADADASVIMLDGLAALPDSTELKGQNVVSARPGSPGELYNEDSQLAFVVLQGADSVPILRSFR